jgi:hypothetical protein
MTKEISLTQGYVAIVDDEDYDRVAAFKWSADVKRNTVYAKRTIRLDGRKMTLRLHAFLTGLPYVDHRDGNGLNNTRANLRQATNAENQRNRGLQSNNTSGYIGVSFDRARCAWYAHIKADTVMRNLGHHATPEEAARVRDAAARELHGEFARLNFPEAVTS